MYTISLLFPTCMSIPPTQIIVSPNSFTGENFKLWNGWKISTVPAICESPQRNFICSHYFSCFMILLPKNKDIFAKNSKYLH